MPSDQEEKYHRAFLSLAMCRTIYNEDERHQYNPGGVPNREQKIKSDPLFAYHVHSCPRYPQRAPGQPTDRQYYALLARDNGSFDPLEIIPKRGQRFESVATQWELTNSVLCSGWAFNPVVNSSMEVTGHSANVPAEHLIHPKGINFKDIADYIKYEIPIYLWGSRVIDVSENRYKDTSSKIPPGWEPFSGSGNGYNGGVSVLVLPNGKVIAARGHDFQSNNGHALPTVSPLDFWTPGHRLVASAIRGLTNRVGGAVSKGFRWLSAPTKELAERSAALLAGEGLAGMAVSTTGLLPANVVHLGRRTLIMGEDMAHFRTVLAHSHSEQGFYDVMIHGDATGFAVLEKTIKVNGKPKKIWRDVSVREVADAIRPHLKPGDQIRLLSCETGVCTGGPAQQFANATMREVWAPSAVLPGRPKVTEDVIKRSFVPGDGGTFSRFIPVQRGAGNLVGPGGGKVTGNVLYGEIPHAK
jgi:hypothetical protein